MPTKGSRKVVLPPDRSGALLRLADSARRGELVAVIGTGVSTGLTNNKIAALSWKGLILNGFSYGEQLGKISAPQATAWQAQLDSTDLDDLLGAAEFMGRKLGAPDGDLYARWLENVFKSIEPTNQNMQKALRGLHAAGIPLCTLNYDQLLEQVTGLPAINLTEGVKVGEWMRREKKGILHLHGSWDAPATCILGIRDYQTTLGNDLRDLIQRSLGSFRRLLFIGCGDTFADPNFSALIKWLREKMKTAALEHYVLVTGGEVAGRLADPTWQGFVEPVGYGASHSELPGFLLKYFSSSTPTAAGKKSSPKVPVAARHATLLQDYRAFLLKDCGQMTIEGVRADMDTAQRRFDLERLFVPLRVLPSPPEIPKSDPERDRKLLAWQEENKTPRPFGEVFAKHKRLALLALPGGGKTLLLKRLAVAYADPARRQASSDALPDLDITPLLIRCREWREHIHRPILTLLKSISDITGQPSLLGLGDALIPLFKKGRILLLVDGLDEIHDDALRTTFVEHLDGFLTDNPHTRLVVTSREAGFSLVAPSLARFCERWRVAPLDSDAIATLCGHWHRLMTGDSPEARAESEHVADLLVRNQSLRRLAENPLLLTMLLVVKHGAGRLPPDRVSLYVRAVEVLLDTWNIKGHDPLNLKEAVPQLAYVAFQLMRAGKQTATEKELLTLLEEAREKVPQIRRYAKDNPQEFLKRVELRSSLLVEAGCQAEGTGTVPFYQFRHLTFQEYLAAVATVEGHYQEYNKIDTVLTPLQTYLSAEEWKEVIPMSAVLARKQAEPLMRALVERGNALRRQAEANQDFAGKAEWLGHPPKLPAPVATLAQCFAEEAEAAPETLTAALQLIAFFARACLPEVDWRALSGGPYGEELLHQAWLLYSFRQCPHETLVRNTYASLAARRKPETHWRTREGHAELARLLSSQSAEEIGCGLLTCTGLIWLANSRGRPSGVADRLPLNDVEPHIYQEDPALREAALLTWSIIHNARYPTVQPSQLVLDRILAVWLSTIGKDPDHVAALALWTQLGLPRRAWTPVLTDAQLGIVRRQLAEDRRQKLLNYNSAAACMVAFHAGNVWSEEELATRLGELYYSFLWEHGREIPITAMLKQMGVAGQKQLKKIKRETKISGAEPVGEARGT